MTESLEVIKSLQDHVVTLTFVFFGASSDWDGDQEKSC